jgi:hypothetical protein
MPKKESEEKIKLPVHMQEQFGMKTWYGHQKLTENLFIWKFRFGGFEFPGWEMVRDEPVREKGGPSMVSSLWQLEKKHAGPVVHVETFECASREAAHDYVLKLLADFQSPDVHYLPKGDYGDAMFSGKTGERMAVFVRGNLVIRLRNAERELTSVFPLAQHLDQLLTEKPEQPKNLKEGPMIVRFEEMPVAKRSAKTNARNEIALTIQAEDPDDYPVWYKFFAPDGEVVEAGKVLTYRPSKSGSHKITAIAVNSTGRTARSSLVLKTG